MGGWGGWCSDRSPEKKARRFFSGKMPDQLRARQAECPGKGRAGGLTPKVQSTHLARAQMRTLTCVPSASQPRRAHAAGSGLGRLDAAVIFEALSYGDIPVTAYLTIHNMVAGVVDRRGAGAHSCVYDVSLLADVTDN